MLVAQFDNEGQRIADRGAVDKPYPLRGVEPLAQAELVEQRDDVPGQLQRQGQLEELGELRFDIARVARDRAAQADLDDAGELAALHQRQEL